MSDPWGCESVYLSFHSLFTLERPRSWRYLWICRSYWSEYTVVGRLCCAHSEFLTVFMYEMWNEHRKVDTEQEGEWLHLTVSHRGCGVHTKLAGAPPNPSLSANQIAVVLSNRVCTSFWRVKRHILWIYHLFCLDYPSILPWIITYMVSLQRYNIYLSYLMLGNDWGCDMCIDEHRNVFFQISHVVLCWTVDCLFGWPGLALSMYFYSSEMLCFTVEGIIYLIFSELYLCGSDSL